MSVQDLEYLGNLAQNAVRLGKAGEQSARKKILTLFGTRPEVIKLAPVIQQLEVMRQRFTTVTITSAQHTDLLYPLVQLFGIRIDHDLQVMQHSQTPNQVCARVLQSLDPVLEIEQPDLILVQGDTTTAMAGALAGFHRSIPVGHVEAGLRSGNDHSPFPEEMNRKLITRLATYHFAATARNQRALIAEGVPEGSIYITGNPVVDALQTVLRHRSSSPEIAQLLHDTHACKRIILTTHRREALGELMIENLKVLSSFVQRHADVVLIFPVHPNPDVVRSAQEVFGGQSRVHLLSPLSYREFILLLENSWLIVSDSGGVQEEAPTLHKPLLIIRENTERPEAVEAGVARLVGGSPERLAAMLEDAYGEGPWMQRVNKSDNPFGRGNSAKQIADIISNLFQSSQKTAVQMAAD
jgi:UDP-N-acetylglucosamine 2-epimerase (non-hydrolysing)